MIHPHSIAGLSIMIAGMLAPMPSTAAVANPAGPPNFVVIYGEGSGWTSTSVQMDDTIPASKGGGVRTPNLERLGAGGMRFANGYAPSPRCTPSRAALLTGRSPAALHMTFVGDGRRGLKEGEYLNTGRPLLTPWPRLELPVDETTIAEWLKAAGYATAHFGKWHLGRVDPTRHGFDESDGPTSNGGPDNVPNPNPKQALGMTTRGIDFMTRQAAAGRPFYLQLSHYPSQPEARGALRPDGPGERKRHAAAAEADIVDRTVGQLLDALDRLHLAETTYVLYTTDHGTPGRNSPLSGGKGTVLEGGLRVPFIIRGPGIEPGTCSHVRVTQMDLFPTFAELTGNDSALPPGLEGGSFASVLRHAGRGTVQRPREEFVVHFPHYDKDEQGPASAIFLGDFKLIRHDETGLVRVFDLANDISERQDLAGERRGVATDLERRLNAYLQRVNAQRPTPNLNDDPATASAVDALPEGGRRRQP